MCKKAAENMCMSLLAVDRNYNAELATMLYAHVKADLVLAEIFDVDRGSEYFWGNEMNTSHLRRA